MVEATAHKSLPASSKEGNAVSFAEPNLPLAVVVAGTRWDEPPRMRHDVTRQLMRWFNVLFVEFFPVGNEAQGVTPWRHEGERLLIYRPPSLLRIPVRLYANDPLTHRGVNLYFTKLIRGALGLIPCNRPILFNFVYHFPEVMKDKIFAYKAYVCFDEFPRMRRRTKKRNALKEWYQANLFQHYENQVVRRANRCFTPSYPLREKLAKVNSHVDMLFHAHDCPLLSVPAPGPRVAPINVGFAGYINWRLLSDWLLAVLQQSDMHLYLIGPVERYDLAPLTKHSNMHHVPPLAREQLMQKLAEMDVLIIPYDPVIPEVSILTCNSKTFQYIASCKPIVISDLPHYIKMPHGVIYRASNAEEFMAQIRRAYYEDCEELVRCRAEIARNNTWDKRGDLLYSIIQDDMGEKLPATAAQSA